MMKKKLHVHFGIHRTGTTSIHKTLMSNKELLSENGVLYPELGVNNRHVRLAWDIISNKCTSDDLVKRINLESKGFNGTIVLSSEDFSQVKKIDWLKDLSKEFDLSGSVFLRRQDLWLESWYNQHIKWPWSKKFSSSSVNFFMNNKKDFYWIDYQYLLGEISSIIHPSKLHVEVMERSAIPDVAQYFITNILALSGPVKYLKEANGSLSKCKLDILRYINLLDCNNAQRKIIISALNDIHIPEDNGSKTLLDYRSRLNILREYQESNSYVAKKYFNRENLFSEPGDQGEPHELDEKLITSCYLPRLLKHLAY